jgi:hypothetical protein
MKPCAGNLPAAAAAVASSPPFDLLLTPAGASPHTVPNSYSDKRQAWMVPSPEAGAPRHRASLSPQQQGQGGRQTSRAQRASLRLERLCSLGGGSTSRLVTADRLNLPGSGCGAAATLQSTVISPPPPAAAAAPSAAAGPLPPGAQLVVTSSEGAARQERVRRVSARRRWGVGGKPGGTATCAPQLCDEGVARLESREHAVGARACIHGQEYRPTSKQIYYRHKIRESARQADWSTHRGCEAHGVP